MLNAEEFPIELLTFEARYDPAYLIWDHAGALWNSLLEHQPDLTLTSSEPNQQVMETSDMRISIDPHQIRVNSRGPKALKQLMSVSSMATDLVSDLFRIRRYKRIGYRCIRKKSFDSRQAALESVASVMPDPAFPSEDLSRSGGTWINRLESETRGLLAGVKVEEEDFTATIPWEIAPRLPDIKKKSSIAMLDADYYTIGITDRDAFKAEEWLKFADKFVTRYWDGVAK